MNGRDLVRRLFRRQPVERVPFLSLAFYQAARVDGGPASELVEDTARLSRAVIGLSQLLGSDVVAINFESVVFAALGVDITWTSPDGPPVADAAAAVAIPEPATVLALADPLLQSVVSVKAQLRGSKSVVAVVPAPSRLASYADVEGSATIAMLRALVDAACKAGAEVIVIDDDGTQDDARLKQSVGPIVNTARYYSASTILATPKTVKDRIADALLLPVGEAEAVSSSMSLGILPSRAEFYDAAHRAAMREHVAKTPAGFFVSLNDAVLHGREMSDIVAAITDVMCRR